MNMYESTVICVLLVYLTFCVAWDMKEYRIPDIFHISALLCVFPLHIVFEKYDITSELIGFLLPFALLFPVYVIRGIGAGDVKMFCVIGAYTGYLRIVRCIVSAVIIGGIMSITKLIIGKYVHRSEERRNTFSLSMANLSEILRLPEISMVSESHRIHFSVAIALSVIIEILKALLKQNGGFWN